MKLKNNKAILDAISSMSVLELCALIKNMETTFGVSSAAVVEKTNPVSNTSEIKANVEAKQNFNIILTKISSNKIGAIKLVRSLTTLGLKEAKLSVEKLPYVIKNNSPKEEALVIQGKFKAIGACVSLE